MIKHSFFLIVLLDNSPDWTASMTAIAALATSLVTIALVIVGYSQIKKLQEANNTQALESIYNQYMSPVFIAKRKRLAKYVSEFKFNDQVGYAALASFLKEEISNPNINAKVSEIKTCFEDVIFLFQKIGYYSLKKKVFSLEDVYMLFSYETLRYWTLIESKIGYVTYLRSNTMNGERDFYESFENLFYKMLIEQVISTNKQLESLEILFYRSYTNNEIANHQECKNIIERVQAEVNLQEFILEEMELRDA